MRTRFHEARFRRLHRHDLRVIENLAPFAPCSAGAPNIIAPLTFQSANATFPFLMGLAETATGEGLPTPVALEQFCSSDGAEPLAALFRRHGSDKSTDHNYHVLYHYILADRSRITRVLEIGLGTNNPAIASNMCGGGRPGGSLRALRDYLPHAVVLGADIDPEIMFTEDRIRTFVVDQTDPESLAALAAQIGSGFDLVIDDGLHSPHANLAVATFALPLLRPGGWLVIEDIHDEALPIWQITSRLVADHHSPHLVRTKDSLVFLLQKQRGACARG